MAIDPTLRDALSAVTTASIARALERAGLRDFAPAGIGRRSSTTIVGPAHTLRMVPARGEGIGDLATAIESVPEGAVVVIDNRRHGPQPPLRRHPRRPPVEPGRGGLVTDATVAEEVGLPVWAAQGAAAGGLTLAGSWQPVACGGAAVHPGDIVVCGPDGVVIVPPDMAEQSPWKRGAAAPRPVAAAGSREGHEPLRLLPPDSSARARFEAETGSV